jgi:predicted nucleotidyltransferase
MAETDNAFRVRQAERDALLRRAIELLGADDRVVAAWLYGSLGRGDADAWSDIDLWVVVADEHIEEISAGRHKFAARLGQPLILVDAPQNAPVGGAFLSVVYGGLPGGPQHVDWTWQPRKDALVPHDARVLLNRGGVAVADAPQPVAQEERSKKAEKQVSFFWMMVLVVAKTIARRQPWVSLNLLALLRYTLDEVAWLTGRSDSAPRYPTRTPEPPPSQLSGQLALLGEMVGEMKDLAQSIGVSGSAVSEEAAAEVEGFLELVDVLIATGI